MSWRATAHFYGQLRSLLTAGITLDRALELAAEHSPAPYRQQALRWAAGCRAGRSLGEQMAAEGERPFPAALVSAGERSGRLPELCTQITSFYEDAIRVRSLVIGRAIYPAVLLHLCTMIPVLPLWFLGKAPGWAVLIGPVALWSLLGLGVLAHHLSRASGLSARLGTKWPLIHLVRPLVTATSCLVLRAGASAGLLWPESLRLAAASCGNRVYAGRLEQAATDIERERLPNLTAAVTAVEFPREVVDLVAASEEAGDLEDGLQRCAVLQQERFRARVEWTARVVMGIFYGLALLAAAVTILGMAYRFYIQPMGEILGEM
jgi:type II secretory pathway component PulF